MRYGQTDWLRSGQARAQRAPAGTEEGEGDIGRRLTVVAKREDGGKEQQASCNEVG